MSQTISLISIVVDDYDKAKQYYTQVLGFHEFEDTPMGETKRWLVVGPNDTGVRMLLAKAKNEKEAAAVGNQTGGRVFLFLDTDDFWRDHKRYTDAGVEFVREASTEDYGIVAVFKDVYGNLWDLVQRT
ncbi:MAG: VOC family protein [Granulosicoccaceae bacterium]